MSDEPLETLNPIDNLTQKEKRLIAKALRKAFPQPNIHQPGLGILQEMNNLSSYAFLRFAHIANERVREACEEKYFLALCLTVRKILDKQTPEVRAQVEETVSSISVEVENNGSDDIAKA